jgi:hypothetical protein
MQHLNRRILVAIVVSTVAMTLYGPGPLGSIVTMAFGIYLGLCLIIPLAARISAHLVLAIAALSISLGSPFPTNQNAKTFFRNYWQEALTHRLIKLGIIEIGLSPQLSAIP